LPSKDNERQHSTSPSTNKKFDKEIFGGHPGFIRLFAVTCPGESSK